MISRVDIAQLTLDRGGRRLFNGLSLTLESGQACALTGSNGSGKTSLLRAVAGLIRPSAGTITFGATDPTQARELDMHLLGHQEAVKSGRTGREELAFWTRWLGGGDTSSAIDRLGLGQFLDLEVRRMSAGQRRRLALARLISAPRPIWLLDEPLGPLDSDWRHRFGETMVEHLKTGGIILAAVHDPLPIATMTLGISG